jgi:adenosylcobinamide kinase / adenosylcobinamide-phosphate guanylyltransferase
MPLTLLTGGARSGKSALAVQAADRSGLPVVFIATARTGDAELIERIDQHRAERPAHWALLEEPIELEGSIGGARNHACVVVDCLSLWIANLLEGEVTKTATLAAAKRAAGAAASRAGPTIAVTNEVGSGVVPATSLGRAYRDLLGRVNRVWADAADQAGLVVAGRVLWLEPWSGLEP